jgi:ADP-ribose pyrophosphatase
MNFEVIKSEVVFRGRVFDVVVDSIKYNSGNSGVREVAVHHGGAVIVPVKEDGKIIFVKQFRYPLKKTLLELPAGKLDPNEDPLTCAIRELEEETGYLANNVIKLGAINTTPGFCTEVLHIYLAKDLIPGEHRREEGEYGMEVNEYTMQEIEEKIKSGELSDAKSICGIYMAKMHL